MAKNRKDCTAAVPEEEVPGHSPDSVRGTISKVASRLLLQLGGESGRSNGGKLGVLLLLEQPSSNGGRDSDLLGTEPAEMGTTC